MSIKSTYLGKKCLRGNTLRAITQSKYKQLAKMKISWRNINRKKNKDGAKIPRKFSEKNEVPKVWRKFR